MKTNRQKQFNQFQCVRRMCNQERKSEAKSEEMDSYFQDYGYKPKPNCGRWMPLPEAGSATGFFL